MVVIDHCLGVSSYQNFIKILGKVMFGAVLGFFSEFNFVVNRNHLVV
jgi:hypothetical protein